MPPTLSRGPAVRPPACAPLPVGDILSRVSIDERIPEPSLTPLPWQEQVLGQEGCHTHPDPVVHPASHPELPHPSVYRWVACPALLPSPQRDRIIRPWEPAEFFLKRAVGELGKVIEQVGREITPDELSEKRLGPCSLLGGGTLDGSRRVPQLTRG